MSSVESLESDPTDLPSPASNVTAATALLRTADETDSVESPPLVPKKGAATTSTRQSRWGLHVWIKLAALLVLVLAGLGVAVYFVTNSSTANAHGNSANDSAVEKALDATTNNDSDNNDSILNAVPETVLPTLSPTPPPTEVPTEAPTASPTESPSETPTGAPTGSPSAAPTSDPTGAPTDLWVPPNPVPENPPEGYFNYDMEDTRYGPTAWKRVNTRNHFLREFDSDGFGVYKGHLKGREPVLNRCAGPDRRQSPKNLVSLLACEAHHEIRTRCGTDPIPVENFQILPHKLSLKMPRRPCLDDSKPECRVGRPPIADYPKYSSTVTPWSDLLNWDIKLPGEHTMEGQTFDAEIQMLHTHLTPDPERVSSIAIPIRATSDGYNPDFQLILEWFQIVYNTHKEQCEEFLIRNRRRDLLRLQNMDEQEIERILDEELPRNTETDAEHVARKLLYPPKFNPYSEAFMRDIFFYRYDGSITEPPCLDITWWVMSDPMYISFDQLLQAKQILFTHVDSNCQPTSVHNANQESIRPIQPLGEDRVIQDCTRGAFTSDIAKGHGNGNKC